MAIHFRAAWIATAAALVLAGYLILVRTWMYLVATLSGAHVPFVAAARIWFVSNLAAYIPAGPGWQLVQMGVMSREHGVGALPAGTAGLINAAVNLACGMAVAVIAGAPVLATYLDGYAWIMWPAATAALLALIALPWILPPIFSFAHRRLRHSIPMIHPPARVILVAVAANLVVWLLYGASLYCLANGVIDTSAGGVLQYSAAYSGAYVVAYLIFIIPGGLGLRENALQRLLVAGAVMGWPQGGLVAVMYRLLTVLTQVLPALLFLAYRRRRPDEKDHISG